MRIERVTPAAAAIRALAPAPRSVEAPVREILEQVRSSGDAAIAELARRFDGVAAEPLRATREELDRALATLDPELEAAFELAAVNVAAVARASLAGRAEVTLGQGQHVELVELPVARAGAYVPGGGAAYPSSVVMAAAVADVADVGELVVCTPPGADGRPPAVVLAACALCGVEEVYAVGGAQAVAALAYGSETIAAVDVVVGPGNAYVTEAKRQVAGVVGIDGLAGPSELVVVLGQGADPELAALDLLAQAEHGASSLVVALSAEGALLDAVAAAAERLAPERPSVADAPLALVRCADAAGAVALADELAPEHLELVGDDVEPLAGSVRAAGCLFVGRDAATAFGDYVAGSNHVLPTGGAARFASALSPATFRRRMARVSLPPGAAGRLAAPGAAIARAEGFPVHAESMQRRA